MEFLLANCKSSNCCLQTCMILKFWKIPEITCAVEFLFTEAVYLKRAAPRGFLLERMQSMQNFLEQLFFQNINRRIFPKVQIVFF